MKAFGIFTIIALTALINGSSALWCECKYKQPLIDVQHVGGSRSCCGKVMKSDLMGGVNFFGLSPRDWCDTSRDKVEQYKACCKTLTGTETTFYGYCK